MSKTLKTGWHVLYVKSCQEKKVHQLLQENQLESFLPMIKTIRQWSDRKKVINKPLFPSYVFVNINSSLEFHKALSIKGACSFIHFGRELALATDKEIEQIKVLVGHRDISNIESGIRNPKIGEKRIINIGALRGLECEVLKVNNKNKIIVFIESLQQNITATISKSYLSEISLCIG
ncbi:UpxY family transcription antiterminator [Aquimarina sp. RZ0]|uniref:UpxY family transcription antiterminator n=1 Tax=Aquimarina sp. RZ0 TaxID=2607730 RepID=UPI0011F35FFB|nr:UpxY family transcription antiterminator [Aquimarina sp. RZ0]KAA1246077.1 UpxY family transcription antiterminator [Aquimarina sp. RZ0]